jgi:CheY-like chemotaxis protein
MLEQAIINLAINSRDAMPRGGRLIISTEQVEFDDRSVLRNSKRRPGKFVSLCVSDTGCGIETENISRIFEPFFTTKEVGKGTGLGLATVYGIVKQHEGWIDVESRVGAGTTFRIFFPSTTKPAENVFSERVSEMPVEGGNETILIVEDEPVLRELVCDILKLYGYKVFTASCGPEAIRLWEQHKNEIDLLLTDMVMPEGLSGRELAEKLLRDNPHLKVIYTSGYSPGMAGRDIALLEGFNFLPKPYPPIKLAQLVRECLNVRPIPARTASA